jgi:hypothetical protein
MPAKLAKIAKDDSQIPLRFAVFASFVLFVMHP